MKGTVSASAGTHSEAQVIDDVIDQFFREDGDPSLSKEQRRERERLDMLERHSRRRQREREEFRQMQMEAMCAKAASQDDRVEVPLTRYGDRAVEEQDHADNDALPGNHGDAAANPAGGSDDGTLRSGGDFTNNGDRAVEEHDCPHEDDNDTSPGNCSNDDAVAAEIGGLVDSILHKEEVDEGEGEGDDSSGDDDQSNYSADETTRHRKKEKRRSRGKSVSDTDEEDLEAEDEMMDDVVPELGARKSGKRFTGKQKGKKRAVDKEKGVDSDDDEANDQEDVPKGRRTPGPLSAKARAEAQALGDHVQNRARALADKYNKPYGSIMLAAGLTIQKARHGQNFSNQFKVWYSAKNPKPEDSKCSFCCLLFTMN